ncbi:MAG: hypothetical protein ACEY3D_09275 [Rickettsia sp.]|uniref:hypothetical protein n=1 Tax=Rickettsia sp. TaxID=789 RepID=UPI00397A9F9A
MRAIPSRHCEQPYVSFMSFPRDIVAWTSKCSLCHSRESGNPEKSINTANF